FRAGVAKLNSVDSTEQDGLPRGGGNDTPETEACCDRRVHILVKMKPNRLWHPLPWAFQVSLGRARNSWPFAPRTTPGLLRSRRLSRPGCRGNRQVPRRRKRGSTYADASEPWQPTQSATSGT